MTPEEEENVKKHLPDYMYDPKKAGTLPIEHKTFEKVTKLLEDDEERQKIEKELEQLKAELKKKKKVPKKKKK